MQVASYFKTLSNLSNNEVENLEDEIINLIETRANLVYPLSLVSLAEICYYN